MERSPSKQLYLITILHANVQHATDDIRHDFRHAPYVSLPSGLVFHTTYDEPTVMSHVNIVVLDRLTVSL